MKFKKDEFDLVHSMWNDESQDIDYISLETGISRDTVLEILQSLSDQKKIKGFKMNENQIILFEDMMDIDDYFTLGLDKLSTPDTDKDYFFEDEKIDKSFQKGPFTILVRTKHFFNDHVILDLDVSYLDETYPLHLMYDNAENVYLLTPGQPEIIDIFYEDLGDNKQRFLSFVNEILDKIIPMDFWETKAKFN